MEKKGYLNTDEIGSLQPDDSNIVDVIGGFWPFEYGTTTGEIQTKKTKKIRRKHKPNSKPF